jgi:hypothetical protein
MGATNTKETIGSPQNIGLRTFDVYFDQAWFRIRLGKVVERSAGYIHRVQSLRSLGLRRRVSVRTGDGGRFQSNITGV